MNHSFYNILLQQMNFLIYDHLYNNINKEKEKENYNYILQDKKQLYYNQIHKEYYKDDHHIFKKIIQIVSLENIQILCIVYTYLYIYNILHKLNKNNLSLFLLFIQNCNYVNSFYISQHTTSKIHKEINDTIFSEVKVLEDDSVLHKLVGLVLVKEEKSKCYDTISRRLQYITGEIENRKKVITNSEEKLRKLFSDLEAHAGQRKIPVPQA
ncbi:hypothetical protein C923_01102 [Plasmodium falciparum UGT5.1]|uniref:Uncharacterized protein n=1 Tax=Plasmodium falciparum UGT5.1 TaxID=1237627 RepID=W7K2L9_PLAFA|nr:hypothetical protein C923_01102 [Plasmodium falciparum UGT5.1]